MWRMNSIFLLIALCIAPFGLVTQVSISHQCKVIEKCEPHACGGFVRRCFRGRSSRRYCLDQNRRWPSVGRKDSTQNTYIYWPQDRKYIMYCQLKKPFRILLHDIGVAVRSCPLMHGFLWKAWCNQAIFLLNGSMHQAQGDLSYAVCSWKLQSI